MPYFNFSGLLCAVGAGFTLPVTQLPFPSHLGMVQTQFYCWVSKAAFIFQGKRNLHGYSK